jgi:hypothetical protein
MKRDSMTTKSNEETRVPKWFITIMGILLPLLTVIALAAIPWAMRLSIDVNTLTVRMDQFSETKKDVQNLKEENSALKTRVLQLEYQYKSLKP